MRDKWTKGELKASVEAYVEMQQKLHTGEKIVKKQYFASLAKRFGRTEKAFEYRMQNISYVLSLVGRQWLPGLRPARNVGANVAAIIEQIFAEIEDRPATPGLEFEAQVQDETAKGNIPVPIGNKKPRTVTAQTSQHERDPKVKAWVILASKGICECCKKPAPFVTAIGMPFLEAHHIRRLADGGSDTIGNSIALCPNCHRELHHGANSTELVERLYATISRLVRE